MKGETKEQLEYLEGEQNKIWSKISELEKLIETKTSDYEKEAKEASERAVENKNASEEAKKTILQNLDEVNSKLGEVRTASGTLEELKKQIDAFYTSSKDKSELIDNFFAVSSEKFESIQTKIAEIEKIFITLPTLEANSKSVNDILIRSNETDSKINSLYESVTNKKKEIDDLYYQIIGVTETDKTTGVETHTPGLKDELENSYKELKSKQTALEVELVQLNTISNKNYEEFAAARAEEFSSNILGWKSEFHNIRRKITELLPDALTVGLSFAYAEKKKSEELESVRLSKIFYRAIYGLIIVSSLPIVISVYSIIIKTPLTDVILRIPRIAVAFIPLYIPILWVAYSANRKMNLSKRLIEEYSHKEVLSKTFEGLSKQIDSIENKDVSSDLRTRLLYNILEVNSENPGKLISDYNKSDHPLMDALDKSVKLSNAVTKLSKLPGAKKLLSFLETRAENIMKEETEKAEEGLEVIKEQSNGKP